MTEISVENIEPEFAEPVPEEPQTIEEPATQPERNVAFQTAGGEEVSFAAAPKKRGRPKGSAKPKGEPKRRGRPPNPVEPVEPVEPVQPVAAPQLDINQVLEPIFKAYMATSEMRKREARRERYSTLFQGMVGM